MNNESELQRLAQLVDLNRQKMEKIAQQVHQLETSATEHRLVVNGLKALIDNPDSNTMVPLGAGVQLLVDRPKDGGVVVDIGSGLQAERTAEEAVEILQTRITEITELIETLQSEFDETETKVNELSTLFNASIQALQAPPQQQPSQQAEEPTSEAPKPTKKKRRSSIGGELTLDD